MDLKYQNTSFLEFFYFQIRKIIKILFNNQFRKNYFEIRRLSKLSRYQSTTTSLLEKPLKIADSASFLQMYEEIFQSDIYDFATSNSSPFIIDCGSNIGLSIIYFKQKFPNAILLGFEPDPAIYQTLKHNVDLYNFSNVQLINKAVWVEETTLKFISEGGASGRINQHNENNNLIEVPTVSLKNLIDRKVDFLKIDIEGAENEVIKDCADKLHLVDHLFIEYHSNKNEKQKLDEILAVLTKADFRYHIKEAYTVAKPFIERPTMLGMDLQLNIFAYRN